jgi:zinc transport system substrate-binding protein
MVLSGAILLPLPATAQVATDGDGAAKVRVRVYASIQPLVYFAKAIGGDAVAAESIVSPGQSPHTFEPTPKQIAGLSQAHIYLKIGVAFEPALVEKIRGSAPNVAIVDASANVAKLGGHDCASHGHEHDHSHDHGGDRADPHVWLDPARAKIIATNVCDALCRADAKGTDAYRSNLAILHRELDELHGRIAEMLKSFRGREFLVYHPAFAYFADAYGLNQVAVETDGKEPSAKQLVELIDRAKKARVKTIFVQPQMPMRAAETLAKSIGARVETLDDLDPNYVQNMERMASLIRASFGE